MIKVLYIEPSGNLWGSERSLLQLLQRINPNDLQAHVCLPSHSRLKSMLEIPGVRSYGWLPRQYRPHSILSIIRTVIALLAASLVSLPDVVHLNQAGFIRIVLLVTRILRLPLVIHVRLADDASLVGARVRSWRNVICIANSRFVADKLKAHGVPSERIIQITNPIEQRPMDPRIDPHTWDLGFVGRLSHDKGIELFLHASQKVILVRPETRAVVVGSSGGKTADGRDYMEAMQLLASELGISENVDFLGFRNDVPELMKRIGIFVMSSEAEPWGRVVAEAMLAGTAVVATDAGGPREIIEHGINGLLVEPGNVTAMASSILRLIKDPGYASKLAAAGHEWVHRECNPDTHAARVTEVYEFLLRKGGLPNSRMQVSIVEPSGALYGSEFALLDIVERLNPDRFSSEVILPGNSQFAARLLDANLPHRELLCPYKGFASRFKRFKSYLKLANHWRSTRPDLIYVNQGGILRPVVAIARLLDIPIICQIQTVEDARWVSRIPAGHKYVWSFVCNSDYIARETKVPHDRLSVIYQGYKWKGFANNRTATSRQPMQVGLLGRICEGKGHYLVIEVAHRLLQSNTTTFHFRFIGESPTVAEQKWIQSLVSTRGLDDLIEFRGYRSDISAEFAELDLLAIPSLAEPLGRILFEAAEAKLPVLASNAGGLNEVCKHFGVGYSFESGNPNDFLDKLNEIHSHYEEVAQRFSEASGKMLHALDMATYVSHIESLLVSVVNRHPTTITWKGNPLP